MCPLIQATELYDRNKTAESVVKPRPSKKSINVPPTSPKLLHDAVPRPLVHVPMGGGDGESIALQALREPVHFASGVGENDRLGHTD